MNAQAFPPPPGDPPIIYPTERITCRHFNSSTPELVHHAALLSIRPSHSRKARPNQKCGTCAGEIPAEAAAYFCGLCHQAVCAACAAADGYRPIPNRPADYPEMLEWDLERRDFLIREIKEQAYNVQGGRCAQCHKPLAGIEQTTITHGPGGPWLLCDRPCALAALGYEQTPPAGSYPTDCIRIVADPRHGSPQDWLNVHYEMSLPKESSEYWSQADCRFAAAIQADPDQWEFIAECVECAMAQHGGSPRPHKWHQNHFFLRRRSDPANPAAPEQMTFNAQALLSDLGSTRRGLLPGIKILQADPDCLKYYQIPTP